MSSVGRIAWVVVLGVLSSGGCAAQQRVALESIPWPERSKCMNCVTVQFDTLEMRIPLALVGRLFVSSGNPAPLFILPKSDKTEDSVLFLALSSVEFLHKYEQAGLLDEISVQTTRELLDALGRANSGVEDLDTLRAVEQVVGAKRFTRASKPPFHVYWIRRPEGESQKLYISIDGEPVLYMLAGSVTPELYDAVLSGLVKKRQP